jgi:DNA-binding transcriptional LysR family regulator
MIQHPMLTCEPLAKGRLLCIVPEGHPLAKRERVSADEIVKYPLIGIDPSDPYGHIVAGIFTEHALSYEVTIRARFGSTVCALVTNGLGIAIIDEFTLAGGNWPKVRAVEIAESTLFQTYIAFRKDATLSSYCERFVASLRNHMTRLIAPPDKSARPKSRPAGGAQKVTSG